MIKVYGANGCPYCEYIKPQLDERFQYCNVSESLRFLKEFINLRESNAAFDHSKEINDLGLPCFVNEAGEVSLKPEDYGLVEYSETTSCSLNGSHHC